MSDSGVLTDHGPTSHSRPDDGHRLFAGPGEMRAQCRALDWDATALGPVMQWSHSLRTTVGLVLASRQPMLVFCGPDFVRVFNDAYWPSLGAGGRADSALGARARGRDFCTDIWEVIGPQIEQVMTTGEATWHEDQYLPMQRNGRVEDVWWTYSYSPVRDDDGHIIATVVVCQETTARVQAERAAVGLSVAEALPEVVKQGFITLLDQVLATGESFVGRAMPTWLIQEPGSVPVERYMDFLYQALTEADGSRSGIFANGVDVTEQVHTRRAVEAAQAEAQQALVQLRAFADAIPTLAWTARADGYITWYNARWYEYTDTKPADMEGWGWQRVHDPAHLPAVLDRWRGSVASGTPFEMTFPLRGADGTFRAFLTRVVPARDADGALTGWFGTNTDVEAEIQLRRTAEDANRAKSQFLAIMSHELRTPLNAIDGYAELIELGIRGPVTDEQRQDLARIRKCQQHLLGLINGVLNYARVEAGVVHYELEDVAVEEVLASCEALTVPQVRSKGLVLQRQPCHPSLIVRADREKFQQIVLNLLSNAIKFTNAGGQVTLACARIDTGGRPTIQLRVGDTGIGISPGQLGRVFEPFVQVDVELTRTREGTGLGLAISRDLARGMGGDLTAESVLGIGSTFTLSLPRPTRP